MNSVLRSVKNFISPICRNSVEQVRSYRRAFPSWHTLKDYRRRKEVLQYGPERLPLKILAKTKILPSEFVEVAAKELAEYPRNASISRLRPRCVITGRPRGVVKYYRVSRIMFRHFADYNLMSGVQRAMW